LACHRLGRLVAHGSLINGLTGIAIVTVASKADLAYLESAKKRFQNPRLPVRTVANFRPPADHPAGAWHRSYRQPADTSLGSVPRSSRNTGPGAGSARTSYASAPPRTASVPARCRGPTRAPPAATGCPT